MKKLYDIHTLFIPQLDRSDQLKNAVKYINDIKTKFSNNPEDYHSFGKTLMETTDARISSNGDTVTLLEIQESDVERIRAKLQGHSDLFAKFDTYLPPKYKSNHGEIETERVLSSDKVRSLNKLSDNNDSRKPSATREGQGKKRKNISEELFCDSDADKANKKILTGTLSYLEKVQDRLPESTYIDLLRALFNYGTGRMQKYELEIMVEEMEKQENFPGFARDLKHYLTQCENIGAKHRVLQRKEYDLDDHYKCVRRKIVEKEKKANKIEDDQLEADLLIEWFKSATTYAKFLLGIDQSKENLDQKGKGEEEQLKKTLYEDNKMTFEKQFLRCLEQMDDDYDILYKENPKKALPVILCRFQVKLQKLQAFKEEHDKRCKEAYEEIFSSKKRKKS